MTYVDDDDFDDIESDHETADDELGKGEVGRCDECGLKVKKDDALICPMCSAVYHRWCVTECNVCKTPLEGKPGIKPGIGTLAKTAGTVAKKAGTAAKAGGKAPSKKIKR